MPKKIVVACSARMRTKKTLAWRPRQQAAEATTDAGGGDTRQSGSSMRALILEHRRLSLRTERLEACGRVQPNFWSRVAKNDATICCKQANDGYS